MLIPQMGSGFSSVFLVDSYCFAPISSILPQKSSTFTLFSRRSKQASSTAFEQDPQNLPTLHRNYQEEKTSVVNALRSEQVWPSNVRNCQESWALGHAFPGKTAPYQVYFLPNLYIAFLIFGLTNRLYAEDGHTYQARMLMVAPEVPTGW